MKRLLLISAVLLLPWLAHGQFLIDPYRFRSCGSFDNTHSLSTNLTAWWKLNEASGDRTDTGPNAQTLTDVNTATSSAGVCSLAATFVAANAESLFHADSATLSVGTSDFTFSFWAKPATSTANMTVLCKGNLSTTFEYGARTLNDGGTIRWNFDIYDNAGHYGNVVWNAAVSTTEYAHVIVWFDNAANTINIVQNDGTPQSAAYNFTSYDNSVDFRIGNDNSANFARFDGSIDEVGFWKRVLTSTERTQLYNGGYGLTYSP